MPKTRFLSSGIRLDPATFLPARDDVMEVFDAADGAQEAREWLEENDIDPEPVFAALGAAKILAVTSSHGFAVGGQDRGDIVIDLVDDEGHDVLAWPLMRDGMFEDLVVLDIASGDVASVCGTADWLGEENIKGTVRLHSTALAWLQAGCTGCCSIHAYSREHLRALKRADRIECDDVALALEAWDWGFGAERAALARFHIDDTEENIAAHFRERARWAA